MKDLAATIKELEKVSLYCYKDTHNKDYNLIVLFFSPDDYHRYVGLSTTTVDKKKVFTCSLGSFYVDRSKKDLFIDTPDAVEYITEKTYKQSFTAYRDVENFREAVLSYNFPVWSEINEK